MITHMERGLGKKPSKNVPEREECCREELRLRGFEPPTPGLGIPCSILTELQARCAHLTLAAIVTNGTRVRTDLRCEVCEMQR